MKKTALFLLAAIALAGLCGCGKKTSENYFGGEGRLRADGSLIYDSNNIYSKFNSGSLKKYIKKTNTLSIACDAPECGHNVFEDPACKANMYYCIFNGSLIKKYNESIQLDDGTVFHQGYLYLCDENEKEVFKNRLPDSVDPETTDNAIGAVYPLGSDHIVLFNGSYMYILDTEFNIEYTVVGVGTYSGGVYYADNVIYYIDNLYRLHKLDPESGEPSPVDLGGMKVWEGTVKDNVLWFNNGEAAIFACNLRTGEIEKRIEHGVAPKCVGKYIEYSNSDGLHYYDPESGETVEWAEGSGYSFFFDGIYYNYDDDSTLTLYEEDLTTVIKTCTLSD